MRNLSTTLFKSVWTFWSKVLIFEFSKIYAQKISRSNFKIKLFAWLKGLTSLPFPSLPIPSHPSLHQKSAQIKWLLFRLSKKRRKINAWVVFCIQILDHRVIDLLISIATAACSHHFSNLRWVCLNLFVLSSRTTKSFHNALRQLIDFINYIHYSNCNS